jgi:hypothetical protein
VCMAISMEVTCRVVRMVSELAGVELLLLPCVPQL